MEKEKKKNCEMCKWFETGGGSSKSLHTCRPSCNELLFVEGAGEFYCNNPLPCKKHNKKESNPNIKE